MITLEGIARHPGIAIAVAAVVDAKSGINAVSPALLQEGISALRHGLLAQDYPQAVVACDSLAIGSSIRIPGTTAIGIAAEAQTDVEGLELEVPCVLGAVGLLRSINEGDIVIVDGNRGVVYVDPEPGVLMHYQQAEEERHTREKVFITSEHIPAQTQDGETVHVYALIQGDDHVGEALENGADGLMVDLRGSNNTYGLGSHVLREAAGKPVVFLIDLECEEILRATMRYCTPWQVTLVSQSTDELAACVEAALESVAAEAVRMDVDVPQVHVGLENPPALIDTTDLLEGIVRNGARLIAVSPALVAQAKYAIRSIVLQDQC